MNGYRQSLSHTHITGILFSQETEGNPSICENMDESWRHYAKWNNAKKDRYCITSLTCYMWKLKKAELVETESGMMVTRAAGGREEENCDMLVKDYKVAVGRWVNSRDLMNRTVIIVNISLNTWKLLRD